MKEKKPKFQEFSFEFKKIVAVGVVESINRLVDIYDPIFQRSYHLLMRVFLDYIKVQFKKRNPLFIYIYIYIYI